MWEKIEFNNGVFSDRLKVYGGWIVRSFADTSASQGIPINQIFISDQNHEWKLH